MQKNNSRSKTLLLLSPLVACLSMAFAQQAAAHGYLQTPPSRVLMCNSGANDCGGGWGAIRTTPQGVEGEDGFFESAQSAGKVASGGVYAYENLDEQTADRWKKNTIKTGANKFTWHHTATHKTKDYRFFLTKQGWNPNLPLTRDTFDSKPFCETDYGQKMPPSDLSFNCNVPNDRSGYHVMLVAWDVGDTSKTFYNVVDLNIGAGDGGGGTTPPAGVPTWKDVGDIHPDGDLKAGDKVKTRVFKSNGEVASLSTSITIASDASGARNSWPLQLAKEINKRQTTMMAGVLGSNGSIAPVAGKNDLFAKDGSGITSIEIQVDAKQPPVDNNDFSVTPKNNYSIENGKAKVDFFVTVGKKSMIDSKLYNKQNEMVGFSSAVIDRSATVSIDASPAVAGEHTLVVTSREEGGKLEQKSFEVKLSGGQSGGSDSAQCQPAYNPSTAYNGGAKVQHKGKIYSARWWTQNSEPGNAANTGADGSGKVWKDEGAAACK
ncbi:lytic polysaccharide monooxygenase [Paraherbaspirillum soli]|uniref:Lytic polysaccharide monooxygenase n=1 Tax=Paraherbaspirillum soli TaxID=631222 RepID=A0ABW0MD35_9BURK